MIVMLTDRSAGLRPGAFAQSRTRNAGSETGAPPVEFRVVDGFKQPEARSA